MAIITLLLVAINKVWYTLHPNQLSIEPLKLSLLDEATHEIELIDRTSKEGNEILKKLYGIYTKVVLSNPNFPISTPSAAEFTVPQIEYNNKVYVVREHPNLRYELWKEEEPDVILLGSSIFFCDFNREVFFDTYPDKKLLDFTTGNNTPFTSHYFMKRADSLHLTFKPGTIVLYGMNRVEMLATYKDKNSHDFVKDALQGSTVDKNHDEQIADFLKLPELRYDVTASMKSTYDKWFRGGNVYRKEIAKKHRVSEESFIAYQKTIANSQALEYGFDEERIKEIKELGDFLSKKGCRLIILKLPQSLYNDITLNTAGQSYFDNEIVKLQSDNIQYIDVSDFKRYNISQLDYLWPGNVFDPEHLNVHGAKRFTTALIGNVLDSMLIKQSIEN